RRSRCFFNARPSPWKTAREPRLTSCEKTRWPADAAFESRTGSSASAKAGATGSRRLVDRDQLAYGDVVTGKGWHFGAAPGRCAAATGFRATKGWAGDVRGSDSPGWGKSNQHLRGASRVVAHSTA